MTAEAIEVRTIIHAAAVLGPDDLNSLGRPHGWRRATPHQGRILTPRAERAYQRRVAALLWADRAKRTGRLDPIGGPVRVAVMAYYRRPKTGPNATAAACTVKPDLDNVVKSILDAMQLPSGSAPAMMADDCQVVELRVSKRWAEPGQERLELIIWGEE